MLTILAFPKPFKGEANIHQRNAIQSWLSLKPKCQIILLGNEEGIAEAANEFGSFYIPDIRKNEFGTPLLDDAFNKGVKIARHQNIALVSADTILLNDLIRALQRIKFPSFLMACRRWNLDVREEINFSDPKWEAKLRNLLNRKGRLYVPSAMDCCIFPKGFPYNFPPFAVGRSGGNDSWLLYQARSLGIPIIDGTQVTTVIHQNHENASYVFRGQQRVSKRIETKRNLRLGGGPFNRLTLRDADWILTSQGLKKHKINPFLQNIYRYVAALLAHYSYLNFWLKILFFPAWFGLTVIQRARDLYLKRGKFWLN